MLMPPSRKWKSEKLCPRRKASLHASGLHIGEYKVPVPTLRYSLRCLVRALEGQVRYDHLIPNDSRRSSFKVLIDFGVILVGVVDLIIDKR